MFRRKTIEATTLASHGQAYCKDVVDPATKISFTSASFHYLLGVYDTLQCLQAPLHDQLYNSLLSCKLKWLNHLHRLAAANGWTNYAHIMQALHTPSKPNFCKMSNVNPLEKP